MAKISEAGRGSTEGGLGDLGVLLTSLGVRSGLWAALAGAGPLTAAEVTQRVSVDPSLVPVAAEAGSGTKFEVVAATELPTAGYDLITFFASLHDIGDPRATLVRARAALAPNGAVLLVEPAGGDNVEDNLNSAGRMFYAVSTPRVYPERGVAEDCVLVRGRWELRRESVGCVRWRPRPGSRRYVGSRSRRR